jgi:hypothetical protein
MRYHIAPSGREMLYARPQLRYLALALSCCRCMTEQIKAPARCTSTVGCTLKSRDLDLDTLAMHASGARGTQHWDCWCTPTLATSTPHIWPHPGDTQS